MKGHVDPADVEFVARQLMEPLWLDVFDEFMSARPTHQTGGRWRFGPAEMMEERRRRARALIAQLMP